MLFSESFSLAESQSQRLCTPAFHLHIHSSFYPILQNSCLWVSAAKQINEPSREESVLFFNPDFSVTHFLILSHKELLWSKLESNRLRCKKCQERKWKQNSYISFAVKGRISSVPFRAKLFLLPHTLSTKRTNIPFWFNSILQSFLQV